MKLKQLREVALSGCRLTTDRPVLAAVSGGPDSLCLLDGLVQSGFSVIAAYFDHALRLDSVADGAFVRDMAARLGVPFFTARGDVAEHARQNHMTVEEAARILRYQFLFKVAQDTSAQAVAAGHTADDQVETVLMHLLRGSGLSGLAGMALREVNPAFDAKIPLVRPLLPFWRFETLQYCCDHNLAPRFDPTNEETVYFRNRLRHDLLPLLEQYNPKIREALLRTSQILAADEEVVQSAVQQAWQDVFIEQVGDAAALHLEPFRGLPTGLQRALLRRAIALLQPGLSDIDFAAVERALNWAVNPGAGSIDLTGGMRVTVEGERLWISYAEALPDDAAWPQIDGAMVEIPIPGTAALTSDWELAASLENAVELQIQNGLAPFPRPDDSLWVARLDAEAIPGPLVVRAPLPGDRFQPLGLDGHTVKLSDFWINQKLPRRARRSWPVVLSAGEIIWVPGHRLAHPVRVQANTRQVLVLRLYRKG